MSSEKEDIGTRHRLIHQRTVWLYALFVLAETIVVMLAVMLFGALHRNELKNIKVSDNDNDVNDMGMGNE
jgi:hypothetical protein